MSDQFRDIGHQVYERIKHKILRLEFNFGERIRIKELGNELGVSSTPIREAMKKLIEDGLITFKPRQGYYVYVPTVKDVKEVYELRKILEQAAIGSCGNKIRDLSQLQAMKKRIEYIKKLPQEKKKMEFPETELTHSFLVHSLNNQRIKNIYENLHNFTLLFQHLIQRNAPEILDEGLNQHLALVEAILHKDLEKGRRVVEKHCNYTVTTLCRLIAAGCVKQEPYKAKRISTE